MEKPQAGRRAVTIGSVGKAVAKSVARLRKRREMTTRQLSAELTKLGRPISASGITRIEQEQRSATVDDITALAKAFRVPPILMLFPIGKQDEVQLPGQVMSPWDALRWFAGELAPDGRDEYGGGEYDEETGLYEWYEDPWTVEAKPVDLFRRHQRAVSDWWRATHLVRLQTGEYAGIPPMIPELDGLPGDSRSKWKDRLEGHFEREIKRIREEIRGHDLKPPRLPRELTHLDKKKETGDGPRVDHRPQ